MNYHHSLHRRVRSRVLLVAFGLAAAGVSTTAVAGAPAGADVPGVIVKTEVVRLSAGTGYASLAADCDPGQVVIGTGAQVTGGSGEAHIVEVTPNEDYVNVVAVDDESGIAGEWSLSAMAICADPLPGYEIEERTSTRDSRPFNSAEATCDPGKQVLGTGFKVNDGNGEVVIDDVWVRSSTRVTTGALEDDTGYSGTWSVKAMAICADPLPGYEIVVEHTTTNSPSPDYRTIEADCGDKRLVGGGGTITGGSGQVVIDDLRPGNHDYFVAASEDDDGHVGTWYLSAYAICVDE